MNKRQFQIGLTTVALLVALRLGLGCHFLYEGVWKIRHHDEFTAEPFLTQAKGPLSGVFYAMLDDIDGRRRLQKELTVVAGKTAAAVKDQPMKQRWEDIRRQFLDRYRCDGKEFVKRGEALVKQGEELANKGGELAKQGEKSVNDGKEMVKNSEELAKRRTKN